MNIQSEFALLIIATVIALVAFFFRRTLAVLEHGQRQLETGQQQILQQVTQTNGKVIKLEAETEAHEVLDEQRFSEIKAGVNSMIEQGHQRHMDLNARLGRRDQLIEVIATLEKNLMRILEENRHGAKS